MKSSINEYFAKKLKLLRTKYSKSKDIQKDIAVKFGMKQQNYSKLENGETNFSDKILDKICDEFNITRTEFITSQSQLPQINVPAQANINSIDDYTMRILFSKFRKEILELKLLNADLEIEVRRYRRNYIVGEDGPPIYVII